MIGQVMLPLERLSAAIALERTFFAVRLHVIFDLVLPRKCFTTHPALVWLLLRVHWHVLLHFIR